MELTKKQAIEEHRKMWNWIADAIKSKEDCRIAVSHYDWGSLISDLKHYYLLKYKNQKFEDIRASCFCCEYADIMSDDIYYDICHHCPIAWSSSTGHCYDKHGEYAELTLLGGYSDENRRKAYILSLKIANLPEREGM